MKKIELLQAIENEKARSTWSKAVKIYAYEIVESLDEDENGEVDTNEESILNGADDWNAYSWGGSSLIYDADIAERTCSPSELKKVKGGERRPNSREEWLDVQAKALYQAARLIRRLAK